MVVSHVFYIRSGGLQLSTNYKVTGVPNVSIQRFTFPYFLVKWLNSILPIVLFPPHPSFPELFTKNIDISPTDDLFTISCVNPAELWAEL